MTFLNKIKAFVKNKSSKSSTISIQAPLSGKVVPIEEVPDMVFAEKIVGDGVAIMPSGDMMVAPCDGTICQIFETNHAFSMESDDGLELVVHFGIDTVKLEGEGFTRIAKEGQRVKTGEAIIGFDLALLKEKAASVVTPIVISNMDQVKALKKMSGSVTRAESEVLSIIR